MDIKNKSKRIVELAPRDFINCLNVEFDKNDTRLSNECKKFI